MSHAYQLMMEGLEAEVSLENALATALDDERFHDVTLKGNDGVMVPANRVVLALRSKFFQTMFLGSFSESKSTTIETDYPGEVIKAVVEYIHTDKATILAVNESAMEREVSDVGRKQFQTLIYLTAASAYYNLTNLCNKVHACMKTYIQKYPSLSIDMLEATSQEGPAISKDVLEVGLSKICSNKFEMLKNGVLCMLSSSALALVISSKKVKMTDQQRFEMVQQWTSDQSDGQSVAKTLIQTHVDLKWIDPDVLSTTVTESGLVTKEQLLDALLFQAKRAKHDYNVPTQNPFFQPQWSTTESPVLSKEGGGFSGAWTNDWLNIPPLKSGKKYCWTVNIGGSLGISAPNFWLGITKCPTPPSQPGGNDRNCWGILGSLGQPTLQGLPSCSNPSARFIAGSCVTMTVDLSDAAPNNGVLSISVDDKAPVHIISNLRGHLNGIVDFWPAASCHVGASVTIESIDELL